MFWKLVPTYLVLELRMSWFINVWHATSSVLFTFGLTTPIYRLIGDWLILPQHYIILILNLNERPGFFLKWKGLIFYFELLSKNEAVGKLSTLFESNYIDQSIFRWSVCDKFDRMNNKGRHQSAHSKFGFSSIPRFVYGHRQIPHLQRPSLSYFQSVPTRHQPRSSLLARNNLAAIRRRVIQEVYAKFIFFSEWFQDNKEWIEDALTIFCSGVLVVNTLTLMRNALLLSRKLLRERYRINACGNKSRIKWTCL